MATMLRPILLSINLISSLVARVITTPTLHPQQTLQQLPHKNVDIMTEEGQHLPGDNQAYFCSSPKHQLFEIEEFDTAPNPPVVYVNLSSKTDIPLLKGFNIERIAITGFLGT